MADAYAGLGFEILVATHPVPAYAMAFATKEVTMAEAKRHVKLFRNGRNQAVRIPVEFKIPGNDAVMYREGDKLIIEPARKRGLAALLASWGPLDEDIGEIDDPVTVPEDIF